MHERSSIRRGTVLGPHNSYALHDDQEKAKSCERLRFDIPLAIMASLSPQKLLWYEQSVNAGAYLGTIGYGAHP